MGDRGFDQRKSYRCPVDQTHAAAELAVGRRRVPIRLYNESSGGFAAVADSDPGVSLGDVVGLRTCNGTFEVRVAHVSRVETPAGENRIRPPQFRLGLERLRDLASLSDYTHPHAARRGAAASACSPPRRRDVGDRVAAGGRGHERADDVVFGADAVAFRERRLAGAAARCRRHRLCRGGCDGD